MPYHANTTTGGVVYSSPIWETKVLAEQWETDAAGYGPASDQTAATNEGATYRSITPLDIAIGKYERLLLNYRVHWSQNTTGRIKFKLDTPTVTSINTAFTGVDPNGASMHVCNAAADPVNEVDVAGTIGYLDINCVIENGATAGTVSLQFGQVANNAAPAIVLEGTHVDIKKF